MAIYGYARVSSKDQNENLQLDALKNFMSVGQLYQNALAAYTRIMEIKNLPTETNGTKILEQINSIELHKVSFSFGERRKVSIATAFKKSADVLIMDEPYNNLDAAAVDMLTEKILRGKSNRITLIISHDERLTNIADEIISF